MGPHCAASSSKCGKQTAIDQERAKNRTGHLHNTDLLRIKALDRFFFRSFSLFSKIQAETLCHTVERPSVDAENFCGLYLISFRFLEYASQMTLFHFF